MFSLDDDPTTVVTDDHGCAMQYEALAFQCTLELNAEGALLPQAETACAAGISALETWADELMREN